MGLKQDEDFLRFLTMGAAGTAAVLDGLNRHHGHRMAELERYATANKIWARKIKRLRLADLHCLDCGVRVEVRTKSQLAIRMSHSERPGREWDAGLRDGDFVAFLAWQKEDSVPAPFHHFFRVGEMREAAPLASLGARKAASEGAERDITWPATVPRRSGTVIEIDPSSGTARYQPYRGRLQTYRPKIPTASIHCYVSPGQSLVGGEEFIFGSVPLLTALKCAGGCWDFCGDLRAEDPVDRYAAVKAAGTNDRDADVEQLLLEIASNPEEDQRIRLEAIASLARFNPQSFVPELLDEILRSGQGDTKAKALSLEGIFILSELKSREAADALVALASNRALEPEARSAAVWGLGTAGIDDARRLLPFIADENDDVALHALAAIGPADDSLRGELGKMLLRGNDREAASAVALLAEEGEPGIQLLVDAARKEDRAGLWAQAALGRLSEEEVRSTGRLGPTLDAALGPMWTDQRNWLRAQEPPSALDLLRRQCVRHLGVQDHTFLAASRASPSPERR